MQKTKEADKLTKDFETVKNLFGTLKSPQQQIPVAEAFKKLAELGKGMVNKRETKK